MLPVDFLGFWNFNPVFRPYGNEQSRLPSPEGEGAEERGG